MVLLIMTPVGLNDEIIDCMPDLSALIPQHRSDVTVLFCNDGKNLCREVQENINIPYMTRLFEKLCTKGHQTVQVTIVEISFYESDDTFQAKLNVGDIFFMAGFTNNCKHVEGVYKRRDHAMAQKRQAVANKCVCNEIVFWGVCGSAISCGAKWDAEPSWSTRTMNQKDFEMFEMLADGFVDYQTSAGPALKITKDLSAWHT